LVGVVGAATLVAEIAAARLLAPYFGSSTFIWANTIAVVLLALSVGYWWGGRMADRRASERDLRLVVLAASALLAAVPFAAGPLLSWAADAFDSVSAGAFVTSLVAVLVLASAPLILLGAVGPWSVRLVVGSVSDAGRVTGRLYALSTLGSLVGTFLAALVLVPQIGTQRTFIAAAACVALAAAATSVPRVALLAPLALAGLLLVPPGLIRRGDDGTRVLTERETTYQYVRVEETGDGERRLILNEGRAIHSVWRAGTVLTGDYWDGYLVLPFASLGRAPQSVAMLGNAGGTVARAYGRYDPATRFDGVEIDGELSSLGRRYFGMGENRRLRIHTADARPWLAASGGRYELIGVDAYRQPYIPFYLTTREFFTEVRDHLTPRGLVIINVGHPEGSDALEKVLSATLRAVFPHVARAPVEDTNTLLMASRAPLSADAVRAARVSPDLRALAATTAGELAPALRGGTVYTDDKAPVEWLVDASILDYAANGGD
jgi:spermidine synthase